MKRGATLLLSLLLAGCSQSLSVAPTRLTDEDFSQLSLRFGEAPGYFDTDNLISNENSFQHVIPALPDLTTPGEVYIGVGPDQNFTYIAHTRPAIAFIIDIRRENLLQHLYFKELFRLSRDRWQYLSRLLGKPLPEDLSVSRTVDARSLCRSFRNLAQDPDFARNVFESVWKSARGRYPDLLQEQDRASLQGIAWPFFSDGLNLKFRSYGRPPRDTYPSLEELLTETDLGGHQRSFLAEEATYQFVRQMQLDNRIIPVIGDLAGPSALRKIGEYLRATGYSVTCFYTSNVEFYLFNNLNFPRFVENLRSLPLAPRSVLIRSYFSYWRHPHPETVPGYPVTSLLQKIPSFLERQEKGPEQEYLRLIFLDFVPIASAQEVH